MVRDRENPLVLRKLGWCWSDVPYGGAAEVQVTSKSRTEPEVRVFLPITRVILRFGGIDMELFKEGTFISPIAGKRNTPGNA